MPCSPRFVYNGRHRGCGFYLRCPVRVILWVFGLRASYLPCLSGANGFCRDRTSNRSLLTYLSLYMSQQVGRQPMSGLQILPNPPLIPSDVFQHCPHIVFGRTLFKPQFHLFPAAQPMCRLWVDEQLVDLSHLWEHWLWEVRESPRTGSLPEYDPFICARAGDSASVGLCRGRVRPPLDPEQSGWEIGRVTLSSHILGSRWGKGGKRDGTRTF